MVFLCLTGCQKEEVFPSLEPDQQESQSPFKLTKIDKDKIASNSKLLGILNGLKDNLVTKHGTDQNKAIYSQELDFYIDTDQAIYIENQDGTYHSYTFMIIRPIDNGLVENLSFSLQEDGSYRTFIVVYDLTQQEQEDLDNGLYVAMENRYSITEIDNIDIDPITSNKMTNECVVGQSSYWRCDNGFMGHNPDTPRDICQANSFDYMVDLIWGLCPIDGGSPNNPPNNHQNNGGNNDGTGTGGNSGHHIVTSITYYPQPWQVVANCIDIVDLYEVDNAPLLNWLKNNKTQAGKIKTYLVTQNACSEEAQINFIEFMQITEILPDAKFERYKQLLLFIENNPWALIQDCAQQNGMNTANYINLYNHTMPQSCKDRLNNLGLSGIGYSNQPISAGNVPLANIDYYGVEITTYPDFDNNGTPDTEAQIYQKIREKFIDLASGEKDNFQFSCTYPNGSPMSGDISWEFVPYSPNDTTMFTSSNPITAILNIEAEASGIGNLAADDGAIMVSGFNNNHWTISTIETPYNGSQPFSGNRQWGWNINLSGNLELFTRAVDVAKISKFLNMWPSPATTECQQDTYYNIAEVTWQNMQQEIANWINSFGGQATVNTPKAVRVYKEKIVEILTTNDSIAQILSNCN